MRLNAVPSRPTSVRSSSTGTRSVRSTSPRSSGSSETRLRRRGDAGERRERPAHDEPSDDEREHEPGDRDDRDGRGELGGLGIHVGERAGRARCVAAAATPRRARGSRRARRPRSVCGSPSARHRRRAPRVAVASAGIRLAALGDVRTADRVAGDDHRRACPRAGPARCRNSLTRARRGSAGDARGRSPSVARDDAARRLASSRSTDEAWKTATVATPMTALTATSSAATMTSRRRRRVHGRRRAGHRRVTVAGIGRDRPPHGRRRGRRPCVGRLAARTRAA